MVICDQDENYAKALAEYFMRRKELDLQVQVYSDVKALKNLSKKEKIEFLMIDEKIPKEERANFETKKTFLLSESPMRKIKESGVLIYKYQSGSDILNIFLTECAQLMDQKGMLSQNWGADKKVIGVFSPVGRIGKTSYCLQLGRKMAEDENVLYINMEAYSGIEGHFPQMRQNLSDALYFSRQEKKNLGLLLTTIVGHDQNLDYIAPMSISLDLKDIKGEEWVRFFRQILSESIYDILILDIGESVADLYDVLESCTEIHLLTLEDPLSKAKVDQLKSELHLLRREDILKKVKTINQKGERQW